MEMERESKYLIMTGMIFLLVAGAFTVFHMLSQVGDEPGPAPSYEFESSIDTENNTIRMTEPNRTVNWNDYLVVVNKTFVMKSSRIAVPGISTNFRAPDWNPVFGCCYDVEVVERRPGRRVWNNTIEAK